MNSPHINFIRSLVFWLPFACVTNVQADGETARFLEKCQVYRAESQSQDFGIRLASEKRKLLKHGVPIKLDMSKCDTLRFQIGLPDGKFTYMATDYPKIEDPDSKGNQYYWDPVGPSNAYWLFRFYGWEWAGWRLVHRRTGHFVETVDECSDAPISVGNGFIATICSGNYSNLTPTVFIADIRTTQVRWSGGLELGGCQERERFTLDDMHFQDAMHLTVRGYCSISAVESTKFKSHAAKNILQTISISELGVTAKQGKNTIFAQWK